MIFFRLILLSFIMAFLLTGCSFKTIEYQEYDSFQSASLEKSLEQRYIKMLKRKNAKISKKSVVYKSIQSGSLNQSLYNFYKNWQGTPYEFGGESKDGIDCSAFTQRAYEESFEISLPRTTDLQSKIGLQIDKNQLEMGDLIFFKTSYNDRHVGIYIQNGMFMHASTKEGVTISSLNNDYFIKHYWKSKRLIY